MNIVPYEAERKVQTNGIEIAYDIFGDPQAPPLILIMGFTMQMIAWEEDYCRGLATRGYRVIRFDNRDVGHSTWLEKAGVPNLREVGTALFQGKTPKVPYLLLDMARDVVGLMDALQIEAAHLVGMSMGGMIAQTLAIHFPERVKTLTSQSSTPWSFDPALKRPTPEAQAVLVKPIPTDRDHFVEASIHAWEVIGGPHMPAGESLLRRRAERFYERGVCLPGLARQMAAIIASGSRRETLRGIRIPTLVLHGDADPLVPPDHARATAEAIDGSRLHFVRGMGHEVPPAAWEELIQVISSHAR